MKFAKRTLSVLLALLMLATVIPVSVYAATLKITTQPKTSYTEYGATAKATIKATGDGLKYTWYIKNAGASKYTKSSVTKSTYSTTMNDKSNGRYVYCVVKDKKGKTVKSSTAILRMKATITTEPKNTYVKQGETAKLTVQAKGDGLKYTWYIKNAGKTKYSKSSVTKSTYSVTMSDSVHGRYVYCVVTDKYGQTDKSKTVVLRQQATIVTQPKNTTVANGETAKLTVKAKGDGLKYQWYIKNAGGTKYSKSSITSSTYSVKMSDKVHGRYVYCIVTDKYGKTEKSKTVVLKQKADPLTIVIQPENATAKVGDQVGFGVMAKGGKAPYTYQWQRTCLGLDGWQDYVGETITEGNLHSLLVQVSQQEFDDQYWYRCVITDAEGNQLISDPVRVEEAKEPLALLIDPVDFYAEVGDTASFMVGVFGGTTPYTYRWQYMANNFSWTDVAGWANGTDATLSFDVGSDEFTSGYQYRCVITDADGETLTTNAVSVKPMMSIVTQPQNVTAKVGDEVSFLAEVEGGKAPYTYQWQIHSVGNGDVWSNIGLDSAWASGQQTERLSFVVGQYEYGNYQYRCVITDANGNQVISDAAWVEKAISIIHQPKNVTAEIMDIVSFSVTVSGGKAPYTYQWEFTSDNLSEWRDVDSWATGGTDNTMSFQVDGAYEWNDHYKYRCVITDAAGNQIISDEAWVEEALNIVTQPQNIYAKVGDTVSFSVAVSGGKAPYTYQWKFNLDGFSEWRNVGDWATGGTGNTMSFQVDGAYEWNDHYKYRCVITDAAGNQIISDAAWVIEN